METPLIGRPMLFQGVELVSARQPQAGAGAELVSAPAPQASSSILAGIPEAQEPPLKRARVTGFIRHINPAATTARVYAPNSKRELKLVGNFPHARMGDSLCGYFEYTDPQGEFRMIREPLITPTNTRDSLMELFCYIFRGKRMTADKSYSLHDGLEAICKAGAATSVASSSSDTDSPLLTNPADLLSDMAQAWVETGDQGILEPLAMLLAPLELTPPRTNRTGMSDSALYARRMLLWWRDNYDLRRIKLLVPLLTDKQIEELDELDLGMKELYSRICRNPYCIPPLTFEQCREVLTRTCAESSPDDELCGQIVRDLWRNQQGRAWTCTKKSWLTRRYPAFNRLKAKLEEEYDLAYDVVPTYAERDAKESDGKAKYVYFRNTYKAETTVADFLVRLATEPCRYPLGQPHLFNDKLDPQQCQAVHMALNSNVCIVTGPAGSGKTTILTEIIKNLKLHGVTYKCCSFTGKAVARIKEVTKDETAATMHRMMKDSATPLFQVLVVDESSMVDVKLLYKFLCRFTHPFRVIFVGDPNQLPPIAWGSFFNAIISSHSIPKVVLSNIHRVLRTEGDMDGIIYNTGRIAKWRAKEAYVFEQAINFRLENCKITRLQDIFLEIKAQGIPLQDFVVINPYNETLPLLNRLAQKIFNGTKPYLEVQKSHEPRPECPQQNRFHANCRHNLHFHLDDKIMMTSNNYEVDIMNGEEGIVVEIGVNYLMARFGAKVVKVRLPPMRTRGGWTRDDGELDRYEEETTAVTTKDITLAFAITCHKSQGSEWKRVYWYLKDDVNLSSGFLNRNLIYTGLTRGKECVTIMGSVMNTSLAIGNTLPYRCETMEDRLRSALPRLYEMEKPEEAIQGGPVHRPPEAFDYPSEDDDDYDDF